MDSDVDRRMDWTSDAEKALKEVPFFVRPAVRKRVESMAQEAGLSSIDEAFYAQAKAQFNQR